MPAVRLLLMGAGLAVLAGCNGGPFPYTLQATDQFPGYGDSVSQNTAVHVIDPEPAGAANTELEFDGNRAALAILRYQTDKVKPPRELRTSDVSGGGGGGGE